MPHPSQTDAQIDKALDAQLLGPLGLGNAFGTSTANFDSETVAADALIIDPDVVHTVKTTGADAEALTLADASTIGQIKVIELNTDGGGDGTLTPATATTWGTIVFADAGDIAVLVWVNSTVGWLILGLYGTGGPPAYTAPA